MRVEIRKLSHDPHNRKLIKKPVCHSSNKKKIQIYPARLVLIKNRYVRLLSNLSHTLAYVTT